MSDFDKLSELAHMQFAEFTSYYGYTMTQWQEVETALFSLYAVLCGPAASDHAISVIYNTLVHIDVKLKVIDGLIQLRFNEEHPIAKEWKTLSKLIRSSIKWRNKLAHWQLIYFGADPPAPHLCLPVIDGVRLSRQGRNPFNEAIGINQMQEIEKQFRACMNGVSIFCSTVWRDLALRGICPPQPHQDMTNSHPPAEECQTPPEPRRQP